MERVLYYPSFFIEDEKWLKFALLYLGEVVSIKPEPIELDLNPTISLIDRNTNLFSSHSPTLEEIDQVTFEYSDFLTRILMNPMLQNDNGRLRNRNQMNYEIYSGKMSWKMEEMLIEHGVAQNSRNGVIVHKDLALEYMALLANIIAGNTNIPTITDKKMPIKYGRLNQLVNSEVPNISSIKTLVNEMEIFLPRDLEHISIERIIEFRNTERNQRNLQELHNALNRFNKLGDLNSENEMLNSKKELFEMKRQYRSQIAGSFIIGGGSALGMYQLYQGDSSSLEYIREFLGLGILNGARNVYGNISNHNSTKRAISYLSDVEQLGRRNRSFNNIGFNNFIR